MSGGNMWRRRSAHGGQRLAAATDGRRSRDACETSRWALAVGVDEAGEALRDDVSAGCPVVEGASEPCGKEPAAEPSEAGPPSATASTGDPAEDPQGQPAPATPPPRRHAADEPGCRLGHRSSPRTLRLGSPERAPAQRSPPGSPGAGRHRPCGAAGHSAELPMWAAPMPPRLPSDPSILAAQPATCRQKRPSI
ncbi:unnamed protein product [Prorocentrum cordatum]|uniref:Uncharacterized protein n=1 Tax=Prorocentrum cordatum TaxID=2364126 RepID=A0ABN9V1C4_9DINO|nr:unnamed protein product [Polarella glacialis]